MFFQNMVQPDAESFGKEGKMKETDILPTSWSQRRFRVMLSGQLKVGAGQKVSDPAKLRSQHSRQYLSWGGLNCCNL